MNDPQNKILKFDPCHLWISEPMRFNPIDLQNLISNYRDPRYFVMSIFSRIGKLISVVGVKTVHPGCGEVFAFLPECPSKHLMTTVKSVRWLLGSFAKKDLRFNRLQATVEESFQLGHRFIEWLGFEKEGLLKAFDPHTGENHVIYGRAL